jgi:hypothetical protein
MSNRSQARRLVLVPHLLEPAGSPRPDTPEAFCAWLKDERERHGLTLAAIADSTKISKPLLAGLEHGQ